MSQILLFFFVAKKCIHNGSDSVNVTHRTSSMFTVLIHYNCSINGPVELLIFNGSASNCSKPVLVNGTENKTVDVTCPMIENFAGRTLVFSLSENSSQPVIQNETFAITLEPLSPNKTNITYSVDESLVAKFSVSNCEKIADVRYLAFRCNSSDKSNSTLSSDCTFQCVDLEPGSFPVASLVRLPIPKDGNNKTLFPEEIFDMPYQTG